MILPNDFIERVKNANNIVDVAAGYLPVKQKGRQYWACCPFHHEKTPSFAISEDNQFFHCFGCGASGNVFKLVMQLENCDFVKSVEILAKKAGLKMPEISADPAQIEHAKKQQRLRDIVECAREFYCTSLNENALAYLHGRGITDEIIGKFNIGQSPNWDGVVTHLKSKGYTDNEMVEAGVAAKSDKGRVYDAMATRIVFSIFDLYGNCIGFTGRILPANDNGEVAKYRNTADTTIFNKGHIVYGGDVLKKYMRTAHIESLIVVEGNVDVITLVSAGFNNTVACMGTAMTPFHAESFARFAKDVYLCLDGDNAGRKATLRSIEVIDKYNRDQIERGKDPLMVRVISLPTDIDPDGFVKQNGKAAFEKLYETARPSIDYKLDILAEQSNLNDNIGKTKYLKSAVEILKTLMTKIEIELYVPKVARTAGVGTANLLSILNVKTAKPTGEGVEKITIDHDNTAIKKAKECIEAGGMDDFTAGTFQEKQKYKEDCTRYMEKQELIKYRNENLERLTTEEIQDINRRIKNVRH